MIIGKKKRKKKKEERVAKGRAIGIDKTAVNQRQTSDFNVQTNRQ